MLQRPKLDASICHLVSLRQQGKCKTQFFEQGIERRLLEHWTLLRDPEIVSPHQKAIASLSVDKSDRFLLAASGDATLSIYDVSKWGTEAFLSQDSPNTRRCAYPPVARSQKHFGAQSPLQLPFGHSTALAFCAWYPVDSGIFFSSARDGSILLWDTNQMSPVLQVKPFGDESSTHGATSLQPDGSLIATGSRMESQIKLVDVRSGAHSHELTADVGTSALHWSPSASTILASGSRDGSIRLWDIRKSGSAACVTILNREGTPFRKSFRGDYAHLRPRTQSGKKRRGGPGNYRSIQSISVKSHSGYVSGLSFFPGGQTLASVGGSDGELLLWDLRSGIPTNARFVAHGGREACTTMADKAALSLTRGWGSSAIWVGRETQVLGYSRDGGSPKSVLSGHMSNITCIEQMGTNLVVGEEEGMISCWGADMESDTSRSAGKTDDHDNW